MKALKEENEEAYNTQFKRYVEQKISPDSFESLYTKAHAAIRADPTKKRADTELGYFGVRGKNNPKPKVSRAQALGTQSARARSQTRESHAFCFCFVASGWS